MLLLLVLLLLLLLVLLLLQQLLVLLLLLGRDASAVLGKGVRGGEMLVGLSEGEEVGHA